MNPELDRPRPTVADEASPVVDDRMVIEKTLPVATLPPPRPPQGQLDDALEATRRYVGANPAMAATIAFGVGALLAELLVVSLRRRSH